MRWNEWNNGQEKQRPARVLCGWCLVHQLIDSSIRRLTGPAALVGLQEP
jgi:hypothetical protein